MTRVELLSPARDLECGIAAVNCGADAVYIGADRYGAREAAGNPLEDIEALARHAHRYWAKVYAALNTLFTDDEIPRANALAWKLQEAGVDGLIVQDAGLVESGLPPLPLIASTQMHNDTPEKVLFLERVGFRRVILARELSLAGIREVRQNTTVELEAFVHGALCVCYSGQCVMSHAIGGRSGNRGQCAQPCRRVYALRDEDGRDLGRAHWLSLRDLNRASRLEDLIDAGVTAFKIEGRLKDKAYVMNVTRLYRRELDRVLSGAGLRKASSGTVTGGFTPDAAKTFNRGYTEYLLDGRTEKIGSPATPKHLGEPVGKVVSVSRDRFTLPAGHGLAPGDGVSFFDPAGALRGTVINRVAGDAIEPGRMDGITGGIRMHRNRDHLFLKSVLAGGPERRIGVRLALSLREGRPSLSAEDEDGNRVEHSLDAPAVPAEKREAALGTLRKQLTSLGGTDFTCLGLDVDADPVPFAPVSEWNRLRRETMETLARARETARPRAPAPLVPNGVPYPEKSLSHLGNVLNRLAEAFYRRHGVEKIEPAAESGIDLTGKKLMTTRLCLQYEMGRCGGKNPEGRRRPDWTLTDEEGRRFRVCFVCGECAMEIYLE